MRIELWASFLFVILLGCKSLKTTSSNKYQSIYTLDDLKIYISEDCRYQYFKIGNYNSANSLERFGLDTLNGKYIWYSNNKEKIIVNSFLTEKYAVKYTYKQIKNVFPSLKGTMTVSVFSKETEKEILAILKKNNIQPILIITPDDNSLGYYESEIDVTDCNSEKAASVLEKVSDIKIHFK